MSVLLGNGDGSFAAKTTFRAAEARMASPSVTSTATASRTWPWPTTFANTVSVLLGNGDGTFQSAKTTTARAPYCPRLSVFVAVGDFNGDGKPDLAVANQDSNSVSVLLGNGDGDFRRPRRLRAAQARSPWP